MYAGCENVGALVGARLFSHTFALERLILTRSNFQFLIPNITFYTITKDLVSDRQRPHNSNPTSLLRRSIAPHVRAAILSSVSNFPNRSTI